MAPVNALARDRVGRAIPQGIASSEGRCHALCMGPSIIFAAASAALAIQSAPASQQAPLKPSGPWNVEFADSMCVLTRDYGEGDAKVTLGFKPGPASDSMRVIVLTTDPSKDVIQGVAQVSLDDQAPASGGFVAGPVKDKGQIVAIDLKKSELGTLGSAKEIKIRVRQSAIRLAPTQLRQAMAALGDCEKDLLANWGMDPAVLASVKQFPTINRPKGAASFFSPNDYPEEALRRSEQGTTGARIHVGADGRVTECQVIESSGSVSIDSQTCNIIRARFRFEPARTADGQAVPSFTYERVRWEMPWH